MGVLIHAGSIPWHRSFAQKMQEGLKALGIKAGITDSRQRESDTAILLGTTLWRGIERDGDYLLVDRASVGDPDYVQLVWNGHGRRGNHCVPDTVTPERWESFGVYVAPWKFNRPRIVLCGQTETYSPHYALLDDWYAEVTATHFRKHPRGENPTGLPLATNWESCRRAITLNSSVGVEAVLKGVPTVTMDEGAMAWDVTGHEPDEEIMPDRQEWLSWLAWTQWHHEEIREGEPIRHLFEAL